MREYPKICDEDECFSIKIPEKDSAQVVRNDYYYHQEDTCYWAKEIDGVIMYSHDDVFETEKLDASHIVIFLK